MRQGRGRWREFASSVLGTVARRRPSQSPPGARLPRFAPSHHRQWDTDFADEHGFHRTIAFSPQITQTDADFIADITGSPQITQIDTDDIAAIAIESGPRAAGMKSIRDVFVGEGVDPLPGCQPSLVADPGTCSCSGRWLLWAMVAVASWSAGLLSRLPVGGSRASP